MANLHIGPQQIVPLLFKTTGESGQTVTALNSSSKAISTNDKVWINKSGNNYSIIDFDELQINCGLTGTDVVINSNGVASNFSASSYLQYFPIPVFNKFESVTKFTTGSDINTMQNIMRYNGLSEIYIVNGDIITWSESIMSYVSCGSVQPNTTYWVKLVIQNNVAELSYSIDGTTYTGNVTIDNNIKYSSAFNIGYCHSGNPGRYFRGSIDLMNSYVILNNSPAEYWRGAKRLVNHVITDNNTLTGIAKENIALNSSGEISVVL